MDNKKPVSNNPTKWCLRRIHSELKQLTQEPIEGILVDPDETRSNVCHALIMGPSDTPYEFGLFQFLLEFPDDYPYKPPRVTLKTTGGGVVRFNPNLYQCGKVCLSILGTWEGPSWSPAHTIGSVLLSIRSLLSANPLRNEPGYEDIPTSAPENIDYNVYVRHETMRIAVLDIMDLAAHNTQLILPQRLASFVLSAFVESADCCQHVCDKYCFLYRDGTSFKTVYGNTGTFNFKRLKDRISEMATTGFLQAKTTGQTSSDDSSY